MEPTAQRGNTLLYLSFIVASILLGIGGYYLGLAQWTKQKPSPQASKIPVGFTKAQNLISSQKDLITRSGVQLIYSGTVEGMEAGKSWTIERNGKMTTIQQEGQEEIRYFRSSGQPGVPPQTVEASEIKVGDNVSITTFIEPTTGVVSVNSVVLQPPRP